MITINDLTMGFSQRTLFKEVSLSIFKKEKIGLTGPNGAGKTTLFSIILGDREPVAGNIQIQKNINIGYLPQEAKFDSKRTVMDELTSGDERVRSLLDEKHKLEDDNKAATDRYGDVLAELEQLGIYELENKAERILTGLGFKQEDMHRPIVELSGGWQMRTLLAKLLTYEYDLLLLDEPTNYLDLEATLWLKDYLSGYQGAFVLISHDRVFLNDVTNYTIVLDLGKMTKIKGNYAEYEAQRAIDSVTLERKQKEIEKKRDQLEKFAQRFHAQPNKASSVKNKRKMIEKLEHIELPQDSKSMGEFEFSDIPSSGYVVARMDNIAKSYDEKKVYSDLNLEIVRGQKVCLVGPNGAGKSTLLKMLAGAIKQDKGEIKFGHQVQSGYFSQTRTDVLVPTRTAFDEVVTAGGNGTPSLKVRSLLGLFSFHGDDVFKTVKVLSGGEKSRLILAKLLINPPNFMLLDEPTTHLDLDGVKALTSAFQKYTGTICFISHDLYFIGEIADTIIEVANGTITVYPGGLEYYLEKKGRREASLSKDTQSKSSKKNKKNQSTHVKQEEEISDDNSKVKNLYIQHKQAKKRMSQIKTEIKNLETETKELETESYVKGRVLAKTFDRPDAQVCKEYGQRLKDIQTRQREIETTIKALRAEHERIGRK